VDAGCLAILVWLTRREGISLLDLVGLNKKKLLRDVLTGLGCMVVLAPVVMIGGGMLSGLLVYGSIQPALPAEVMTKHLPLWAALYARMVWWVIWSVTEEMIYTGYALPRLQRLTGGRTALAVAIVGFFWAIQHSFLPFIPDVKVFLYLFVQMVPLVTAIQLLYLKFRRLPPLIVMHWGMDLFSTIIMITVI
jgi:membrane protease YdiL (CAAX protease family)